MCLFFDLCLIDDKEWIPLVQVKTKKSVDREEFEAFFENMNASWGFEGAELSQCEKELLYQRVNDETSYGSRFVCSKKGVE